MSSFEWVWPPDTGGAQLASTSGTETNANATPATVAAVAGVGTVVGGGSDRTVTATTAAATITQIDGWSAYVIGTTLAVNAAATVSTVAAIAAVPAPTVTGTVIVTPDVVVVVATVPSVTIPEETTVLPATVAAVAAVPAVQIETVRFPSPRPRRYPQSLGGRVMTRQPYGR